jgi:hypothetical protein
MELDDFKQDWRKADEQSHAPNYNINKLLTAQSNSALNSLKAKYRKQIILLPLAAATLGFAMTQKPILQNNAFIWLIMPLMLLLALMYYRDYRLVINMEQTTSERVKDSIQQNVVLLNRNAKQHLYFTRVLLLVFILILEVTIYYQVTTAFNFWVGTVWPIRLTIYALAVFIQPYITRFFFNKNFGQHINRLQQLLEQSA